MAVTQTASPNGPRLPLVTEASFIEDCLEYTQREGPSGNIVCMCSWVYGIRRGREIDENRTPIETSFYHAEWSHMRVFRLCLVVKAASQ